MIVVMHEKIPCIIFCNINNGNGILTFESIVIDCIIVEIPPKLMIKEAAQTAKNLLESTDKLKDPFVISTRPSSTADTFGEKSEKTGKRHSITMKNIVIIQPTDKIASVEFNTISPMSKVVEFWLKLSNFSLCLDFTNLKINPFIMAPIT